MVAGASHLGEYFIQPLEGAVKVNLYPTRCGGDVLAMVLRTPTFDEGHSDGAHLGQLVHRFEAVIDALGEKSGEFLIVEDLETAAGRYLTDSGGVEPVVVVAVATLNEDCRVAETLGVHLAADVVEVDALADVTAGVLDGRVSVDV